MNEAVADTDRITNLPADMIHCILVLLPIKDAGKTSVLSTKWRYHWRSIPELVFDNRFARIPYGSLNESEAMARSKLISSNIYNSLLAHDGPITKFVLSVTGLYSCDDEIDLIALYLSDKGVKDFALFEYFRDYGVRDGYQMHSSLFSALHLESLELESCCVFTPPTWFAGFSKLNKLQFSLVTLPNDFFDSFLPKCPMLEHLRLSGCHGLDKLEIVAPVLKSFHIFGSSLDICFKCTPLLSHVSLSLFDSKTPDMVSLFASLPALQWFRVYCDLLKKVAPADKNVLTRLPTPLHQLKVLQLCGVVFGCPEMGRVLVCLIMNSPNLRRLGVEASRKQADDQDQPANSEVSTIRRLLEVDDFPGFFDDCFRHLRDFTIEDSCGTQVELDLVRFVLATASLLQQIHITPARQLSSEKILKFTVEAMRYKRASTEAELIYDLDG